ncbi:MAG: hypothetical protein PHO03_04290, partial [Candidatus Omnitrophica bacterium]|nr:hypothetical protein [Candidatus Omnitrophota bacterium]
DTLIEVTAPEDLIKVTSSPLGEDSKELSSYVTKEIDRRCDELYIKKIGNSIHTYVRGESVNERDFKDAMFKTLNLVVNNKEEVDIAISLILERIKVAEGEEGDHHERHTVIWFNLDSAHQLLSKQSELRRLIDEKSPKSQAETDKAKYQEFLKMSKHYMVISTVDSGMMSETTTEQLDSNGFKDVFRAINGIVDEIKAAAVKLPLSQDYINKLIGILEELTNLRVIVGSYSYYADHHSYGFDILGSDSRSDCAGGVRARAEEALDQVLAQIGQQQADEVRYRRLLRISKDYRIISSHTGKSGMYTQHRDGLDRYGFENVFRAISSILKEINTAVNRQPLPQDYINKLIAILEELADLKVMVGSSYTYYQGHRPNNLNIPGPDNLYDCAEPVRTKAKDALEQIKQLFKQRGIEISSSPLKTGGIDFRALPMTIQPMGSFSGLNFKLPQLSQAELRRINIDSEMQQIRNMIQSGVIPSGQRIKELVAACVQKKEMNSQADSLLLCLADIFRLEEENASESSPELREALVIVDSRS